MENCFPKRLKELRELKSLSQQELALAVGSSKNAIYFYEKEKRVPDINTLLKISAFFDVTPNYLLGITDCKVAEAEIIKDYTGLSGNAISRLHSAEENTVGIGPTTGDLFIIDNEAADFLNSLIEDQKAFFTLSRCFHMIKERTANDREVPEAPFALSGLYWECQNALTSFIKRHVGEEENP